MKIKVTYILTLLLTYSSIFAQIETPGKVEKNQILLVGGVAHIGNGKVIEQSYISIRNGKIGFVMDMKTSKIDQTQFDTVINISNKHVYPGFIAPNSTLGLTEIGAVRMTHDFDDVGTYNPHVRSIIAYNTDSKITTTVRSNGVLMAQTTPRGGVLSGTSSIVHFDAWNWEDAIVKMDDGIHLNWSSMFNRWTGKRNKNYLKTTANTKAFFDEALAYSKKEKYDEVNIRFEAMRGIFTGKKTLFIHANFVKEITAAVSFIKRYELKKCVIVGGYDAWMVADMLKENNVSVMLRRLHGLPKRQEDDIDLPYKLPHLLHDAGVLFCLENSGDMEAAGTRNLPFYAGTAAAYGLDKEEALKLITLNTAKILGIDDKVGSLEGDKDATLFVSTGDALDMRGNNVIIALVQGRFIDLDNHQKKLYRKFKKKYEN